MNDSEAENDTQAYGIQERAKELLDQFLAEPHLDFERDSRELCESHPLESEALRALLDAEQLMTQQPPNFAGLKRGVVQANFTDGARAGDIIGDFRLLSPIAKGGQGEVWKAEQRSLGRLVAFKLVLPDRINAKTLALFAREARAGGRLAHPGIVAVHDFGEDDGRHWISQELIEGGWTLRNFIDEVRNQSQLPKDYYRSAAKFIAELAEALHEAHTAGVIHRDVKPQNVLVTKDNHPKLTDFGLARITDEEAMSMTGDFAGTWLYMSPEQVTAARIELDHRTDIFSLGVVMYEMMALVRPFDGDTTHQIAENIVMRDPPDLHKVRSRVPVDLAVICGKALEKRKDNRYATAAEFAADIQRHLSDRPILAKPPTQLNKAVKWVRRHPTKSVSATLAAVSFVVISWLGWNLAESNTQLETTNGALILKTTEAETNATRARENERMASRNAQTAEANAKLAEANANEASTNAAVAQRKAADVLRLSLSQDYADLLERADALWPAHPSMIAALEHWMEGADRLITELPALEAKREALRANALEQTEAELQTQRESHPEYGQLLALAAELNSKRNALSVRQGNQKPSLPSVDWNLYPSDARSLKNMAWDFVKPERDVLGQEALGMALALRAMQLAPPSERPEMLIMQAWGRLALGEDDAALDAGFAALESATEAREDAIGAQYEQLELAAQAASNPARQKAAAAELAELGGKLAELEARVNQRRLWSFSEEQEAQTKARWWHDQLSGLIERLASLTHSETGLLAAGGINPEKGWSIPRRLEFARRLERGYGAGGEFAARWERDLAAIRADYAGLELGSQMGLVPLGADRDSKLWEFWDVASGEEPRRDAEGKLVLSEASGLVFVLLPPGSFKMGATRDPHGPQFDRFANTDAGPVHEVELSAFFLSKYEMTQGQWKRLSDKSPSAYGPGHSFRKFDASLNYEHDLRHPVEQVSWLDCMELLPRFAMRLPSEAQWEYAARAGTGSVWWTGDERSSLRLASATNMADQAAGRAQAPWDAIKDWPLLNDRYVVHAPVDAFAPNAFGLHNVCGNLWEWCLDGYDGLYYGRSARRNPLSPPAQAALRVNRGGSFTNTAVFGRSSNRNSYPPGYSDINLGLRPSRELSTQGM